MRTSSHQDETINESYRNAYRNALRERAQHAADLRTMNVEQVVDPRVARGNHEWPPIDGEANMADKAFIENSVNDVAVINAAVGETL